MSDSDSDEYDRAYKNKLRTILPKAIDSGDESASSASRTTIAMSKKNTAPWIIKNTLKRQAQLREEELKKQEKIRQEQEKIRQEQEKIRQEELKKQEKIRQEQEKIRLKQRMKDEEMWNKAKDKLKTADHSIQPGKQPHNKYNETFLPENSQPPRFKPTLSLPGVYRQKLEWYLPPSPLGRGGRVKTRRRHKYKKSFTKRILQRRSKLTKARRRNGDK
jgi:hypothetical protein